MRGRRSAIVATLLLLCVSSVSQVAIAASAASVPAVSLSPDSPTTRVALPHRPPEDTTEANNSTVHHINPGGDSEIGRNASTAELLVGLLRDRLVSGVLLLAAGEYRPAREQVGTAFDRDLRRYELFVAAAPVAVDEDVSSELRRAVRAERELIVAVETYRESLNTYRAAKRTGDEQRAKEAARRLQRLKREINSTSDDLERSYAELASETEENFTAASEVIDEVVANVTETQSEVQDVSLAPTRLRATTNETNVSATRPLIVTGRLVTANGTALDNETVQLRLSEDRSSPRARTETRSNGTFRLRYRPVSAPVGSNVAIVEFVPEPTSKFARSNTTLEVEIEQETPSLSVATTPSAARFDDAVSIAGRVEIQNVSLSGVPIVISLGNRTVASVRTNTDGRYNHTVRVPLTVAVGDVPVRARVDYSGRAIAGVERNTTLTIRRTETSISINATNISDRRVRVRGQLNATGGIGVTNQQVIVSLGGTEAERLITTDNGSFRVTLEVPAELLSSTATNISVGVRFDPTGTNLAGSEARTRVLVPGTGSETGAVGVLGWILARIREAFPSLLLPIGAVAIIGAGLYLRRRGSDDDGDAAPEDDGPVADGDDGDSEVPPATGIAEGPSPSGPGEGWREFGIEAAREKLDDGLADAAIELAYASLKRRVAASYGLDPTLTHWEFYAACADADPDPDSDSDSVTLETLEWLTATYERAAFAPNPLSRDTAERYVREVETIGSHETDPG